MKKIILHFPFKIDRGKAAASQLRPIKIIDTFENMGYEVSLVEGYGKDRKKQIKRIKTAIKAGENFEFIYSECSTSPTLLTEKHHFPTYPLLDFSFFKFCKRRGIRIGLFYRDAYWAFPEFSIGVKSKIAKFFHMYDLYMYEKLLSVLFVPSYEMLNYIPKKFSCRIEELYPGCNLSLNQIGEEKKNTLNILFVGTLGSYYDLLMFIRVVREYSNIRFTICCKPNDWDNVKEQYVGLIGDNVCIVHCSGKETEELYKNADLACLFFKPSEYSRFAVPYKLFETIGYGIPIIATKGTWIASFVEKNEIGYISEYDESDLHKMITKIVNDNVLFKSIKTNIKQLAKNSTWENRCIKIEQTLSQ